MKMRYALRRQEKIRKELGSDSLKRIVSSLDAIFEKGEEVISQNIESFKDEPYPVLIINDITHPSNVISFYVVRKMYNVYLLAFKKYGR